MGLSVTPPDSTVSYGPNAAPVAVALDLQVLPGPGSTELLASGSDCRPGAPSPTTTSGGVGVVSNLAEENVGGLFNHLPSRTEASKPAKTHPAFKNVR